MFVGCSPLKYTLVNELPHYLIILSIQELQPHVFHVGHGDRHVVIDDASHQGRGLAVF